MKENGIEPAGTSEKTPGSNSKYFVLAIDLGGGGPKVALVSDTGEVVGPLKSSIAAELGLQLSTQVIAGIGDSSVSIIGSGAVHDFETSMEVLAYNNHWTRRPAEEFIGHPIDHFRFSGGGALSDVWSQIHVDVLGVPIHQVADPLNTTVRGVAMLAFVTLGYRSIEEIPNLVKIKQIFEPVESNRAIYDKMYRQYRELFERNKKIFVALNAR